MRDTRRIFVLLLASTLIACGGSGSDPTPMAPVVEPPMPAPEPEPEPVPIEDDCTAFDSTFAAIQTAIFENRGCTQQVCHGDSAAGGLDLRADVAYANLIEVPSTGSALRRVVPGDRDRSFLFAKLAAATRPGSVEIAGAPMPTGLPPLSEDELEALRLWITLGASEDGAVEGTESLLDACLPPAEPITIRPLDPPAPDDGVQFVMPPVTIEAGSEREVCFASYYDIRDRVPEEFIDPTGEFMRIRAQELRQDPVSHHLVLMHAGLPVEDIDDPIFGAWTCGGGVSDGTPCDPLDLASCGDGICRSEPQDTFACIGFGPPNATGGPQSTQLGGAQESQAFQELYEGVYGQVPMWGVVYWNSHSFNLTDQDHELNGRLNLYYASDQRFPVVALIGGNATFLPNNPPYTEETFCADLRVAQGTRLFSLTSHNHQRGIHFWAEHPDGTLIYENFVYNDPVRQPYDPPLEFDSADPAERTIRYCSTFNNGLNPDGTPNPETVTRASRIPASATLGFIQTDCTPVACVSGRVGATCSVDSDCDSSPGAGDGFCDACPITGGESTENEMFILLGQSYIDESFPQPPPGFAGVGF